MVAPDFKSFVSAFSLRVRASVEDAEKNGIYIKAFKDFTDVGATFYDQGRGASKKLELAAILGITSPSQLQAERQSNLIVHTILPRYSGKLILTEHNVVPWNAEVGELLEQSDIITLDDIYNRIPQAAYANISQFRQPKTGLRLLNTECAPVLDLEEYRENHEASSS